jgi:transposase-like protein
MDERATGLCNRSLMDALIVCCDGLKGRPEAIRVTPPNATVQTCVVHLVRNSLRSVWPLGTEACAHEIQRAGLADLRAPGRPAFR